MSTPLSPTTQAVLDAFLSGWNVYAIDEARWAIAAALKTAVAHTQQRQYGDCWICDANELLTITAELEGQ